MRTIVWIVSCGLIVKRVYVSFMFGCFFKNRSLGYNYATFTTLVVTPRVLHRKIIEVQLRPEDTQRMNMITNRAATTNIALNYNV